MPPERRTDPDTVSLTDPGQAEGHFRAMLDRRHLGSPTVLVVCCDHLGRPIHHVHVVDCDLDASPSECAVVLDELLERVGRDDGWRPHGLALGLTRPGAEQVLAYDRAWFRALYRVCHRRGLTPHAVYTVTRAGARPLHIDDAA